MTHPLIVTSVLVFCVLLAVIAQWRKVHPVLWASIGFGLAVRLVIMYLAVKSHWQPVDYDSGFRLAGRAVLHGKDPVLASKGSWHFLPMIPYMYGFFLWTGLKWRIAGRLVTVLCDLALIPLVYKLAGPGRARMAAWWYACSPMALLVSVIHGQIESVALAFLVASYLAARTAAQAVGARRTTCWAILAGALFGFALSTGSWPVILLPVMLSIVPTWRRRLYGLIAAGAVPLAFLVSLPIVVHTSTNRLVHVVKYLGGVRPIVGEWGWTAIATGGNEKLVPGYSRVGQIVLYSTLLLVAYLWRRADRVDMTSALLLAFLIVTPRMGAQYLLWIVPFLCARPTRFSPYGLISSAVWAGTGYLYLTQFQSEAWVDRHVWWSQLSLLVIPLLVLSMPWERRKGQPMQTDSDPVADTPQSRSAPPIAPATA